MSSFRRRPRLVIATFATATGLLLGACGGAGGDMTAAQSPRGQRLIEIKNFAFEPAPLQVTAPGAIQLTNQDSAPHTVTADDKSFDSGNIGANEKAEITVTRTGEIPYHCTIHDYMRGVIRVGQ